MFAVCVALCGCYPGVSRGGSVLEFANIRPFLNSGSLSRSGICLVCMAPPRCVLSRVVLMVCLKSRHHFSRIAVAYIRSSRNARGFHHRTSTNHCRVRRTFYAVTGNRVGCPERNLQVPTNPVCAVPGRWRSSEQPRPVQNLSRCRRPLVSQTPRLWPRPRLW